MAFREERVSELPQQNPIVAEQPSSFGTMFIWAVMGLIIALIIQSYLQLTDRLVVSLLFVGLCGAGWLVGFLRSRGPAPSQEAEEDTQPSYSTGSFSSIKSDRSGGSDTMRFVAIKGTGDSSSALKPYYIPQLPVRYGPPPLAIRLLLPASDYSVRLPVMEEVLTRLPLSAVVDRVSDNLPERCPRTVEETKFRLSWWAAEGPLSEDGSSPYGWTLRFVDNQMGIGCLALVTRAEVQLYYYTMTTSWAAAEDGVSDPGEALKLAVSLAPVLEGRSLRLCGAPPSEVWIVDHYTRQIIELDLEDEAIRNKEVYEGLDQLERKRRITLEDLLAFYRGEEPPEATSPEEEAARATFRASLEDEDYASGLRELSDQALKTTARRLYRYYEPGFGEELYARITELEGGPERDLLVQILGWLPTAHSLAWMQRLALTTEDAEVKSQAEALAQKRRLYWQEERHELFFGNSLSVSRERMGKFNLKVLALRPLYDLEEGILQPLEESGLRVLRRRYLSGSAGLVLGASMRAAKGDTEAFLLSAPVPLPCHILILQGSGADVFETRLSRIGLIYTDDEISQDAVSQNPMANHRAALASYGLRQNYPGGLEELQEAMIRGGRDHNLARALLSAATVLNTEEASQWVKAAIAEEDRDERKQYLTNLLNENSPSHARSSAESPTEEEHSSKPPAE